MAIFAQQVSSPMFFMLADGRSYYYQVFATDGKVWGVNLYDGDTGDFVREFDTIEQMEAYTGWKGEKE